MFTELPRIEDNNSAAANLLSAGRDGSDEPAVVAEYQG
jgi:hypothetical protein